MSRVGRLTSTSYAVLGLLALRPWTTHELVQQVELSLRRIWPRASSKLYEEPKKLVAHGLAEAADDPVGRRRRTRYTVTPAGRRSLSAWLAEPGAGPVLESEHLLKIHFADGGTKDDVLAHLADLLAWARAENEENLATARAYLAGDGRFPERAALNQLTGRFLTEHYLMVARWAQWAIGVVEGWPDDLREAPLDPEAQREAVRLAEQTATLGRPVGGR